MTSEKRGQGVGEGVAEDVPDISDDRRGQKTEETEKDIDRSEENRRQKRDDRAGRGDEPAQELTGGDEPSQGRAPWRFKFLGRRGNLQDRSAGGAVPGPEHIGMLANIAFLVAHVLDDLAPEDKQFFGQAQNGPVNGSQDRS